MSTAAQPEAPLRITVFPVAQVPFNYPKPGVKGQAILGQVLRERLAAQPGIRMLSENWSDTLYNDLFSGRRDVPEQRVFAAYTDVIPLDALVAVQSDDKEVSVLVYRRDGIRRHSIPFWETAGFPEALASAADFLGKEFKLAPSNAAALRAPPTETPDVVEGIYLSRRQSWSAGKPAQEGPLRVLQPLWKLYPTNAAVDAEILKNIVGLHSAIASPRLQDASRRFAVAAFDMAEATPRWVLGTPLEEMAYAALRDEPARYAKELLATANALNADERLTAIEELETAGEKSADSSLDVMSLGTSDGPIPELKKPRQITLDERLGALRGLGVMQSTNALPLFEPLTRHADPRVRATAAQALQYYSGTTGIEVLVKLTRDTNTAVALTAAAALTRRGNPGDRFIPLAEAALARTAERRDAAIVLAGTATNAVNARRLIPLRQDVDPVVRALAAGPLCRNKVLDSEQTLALLNDPDEEVVLAAAGGLQLPPEGDPALLHRLQILGNQPYLRVADQAQTSLIFACPAEAWARRRYDLMTTHPTIRMRIVEELATNTAAAALDILKEAVRNPEAHTRSLALDRLAERDPAAARPLLAAALDDAHRWVRLHAAARLAGIAGSGEAAGIRKALAGEQNEGIRSYLEVALARAENKPLPPAGSAARSVAATNCVWQFGLGLDCGSSPINAYYLPAPLPAEVTAPARRAGKIIFARLETVGNSGMIIADPATQDNFWMYLDQALSSDMLTNLDGVVFGEETMDADPETLWNTGWRVFCRDAGIDAARIQGNRQALSAAESQAWDQWASTEVVNGFNELYDYVKLRTGRLRPGFQVATFLPGQGGFSPADKAWKFDVGGVYDYKGSSRVAGYTMIRRYKTMWPDRPVIWMSLGVGGYEMNPVYYDLVTPSSPLMDRWSRAYSDSVTAWLAGADAGWFSTWFFVDRKHPWADMYHMRGVQILVDDIRPDSPKLRSGIDMAFQDVDAIYRDTAAGGPPKVPTIELDMKKGDEPDTLAIDEPDISNDVHVKRVKAEKERMFDGFHFYRQYVYDCARVFRGLPRRQYRPEALIVVPGISVWSPAGALGAPGIRLLHSYDYLADFNRVVDLDLSRYRFIALSGLADGALSDATMTAMNDWLRNQPGVLYVHGWLCADNGRKVTTIGDMGGKLKSDWPWEKDVAFENGAVKITGANAKQAGPGRVVWQNSACKGVVVFDDGAGTPKDMRTVLEPLLAARKSGVDLSGPLDEVIGKEGAVNAAAASGESPDKYEVPGVDLLTGEPRPEVGPGRQGAIVARDFKSTYVAAFNGVAALSDQPLGSAESVANGVLVASRGLIHAGSESGGVTVSAGGKALPEVTTNFTAWLLYGSTNGVMSVPLPDGKSRVTFIRSQQPVTILKKP